MFLLPFIQEFDGPMLRCYNNSSSSDNRQEEIETDKCIFLQRNNQLLKFKISVDHIDITSTLEKYLNDTAVNNFEILSEKDIQNKFPLKLVRSVGKYRLEGNVVKTKNYLVPPQTAFSDFLNEKYKVNSSSVIFISRDLYKLKELKAEYKLNGRNFEVKLIKYLLSEFEIELIEIYDINSKEIESCIENIEKLIGNDESKTTLSRLRWILTSSKNNEKYINELDLEKKFMDAIKEDRTIQKVK